MKSLMFTLVLQMSVSVAQAFTLNSSTNPNLKGWQGGDVKIIFEYGELPSRVDVEGLISEAVTVWNNVPTSSIKVAYGGATTSSTYSNPPTVYCETNFASIGGSPDPNSVPGAASVQAPSGQITSGVIFLNATAGSANIGRLDRTMVKVVIAHEIGHLLGLGHSASTNALMYYDATSKKQLSLAQDDMDGMSYLYPSDELKDGKVMGCGLVRNLPPPSGGQGMMIFALMLLPLLLSYVLKSKKGVTLFKGA